MNQGSKEDNTALMCAAENGYNLYVKTLLKAGADVNQGSKEDNTALTMAV